MIIDIKTALLFLAWTFTYMNLVTSLIGHYSHFSKDNGKTYETRNTSRPLSIFSMGEGLHKNHHEKPGSWNLSTPEYPYDTGAKFIKLFLMKKVPY
jgi:fatty-acid desaturase